MEIPCSWNVDLTVSGVCIEYVRLWDINVYYQNLSMTILFPPILAKLNTRLKEARLKLGLKQADLAEAGGVTRTAQVRYESGETAPSTDYIHGIQSTGIDVPFILFGCTSNDIVKSKANGVIPNGSRARQSVVKKIWESQ
jgi:hypothetical protein